MAEFFFRTEDLQLDEVESYFVDTAQDRRLIDALKSRNPVILSGSRGVGKSFLLRMAQSELLKEFKEKRVFPVYLSFIKSSLLQSDDPDRFRHWMLARICAAIVRALKKQGLIGHVPPSVQKVAGGEIATAFDSTEVEKIAVAYEDSWKDPKQTIDASSLPTVEELKQSLEDLAEELDIKRFALFIDEAAHIFLPEQQRQFFTLFRDLRCPSITCNAAVYPGVTSFGDSFQPAHDATMLSIERDVRATDYIDNMRDIVMKQADSTTQKNVLQNGRNFAVLAFAATGNPRVLLKTIALTPKVSSTQINDTVREFYRTSIWAEHTALAEKYEGHRKVIDWGRNFIEKEVLPDISAKNKQNLETEKSTSAYFWVHKDAPHVIREALRILAYTGVVIEQESGMRASRSEIGQRYMVNLGCLFSLEARPAQTAFEIATALTPKRMTEFGANYPSYRDLTDSMTKLVDDAAAVSLKNQMKKGIDVLDLTPWQKERLSDLKLTTVGDVFAAKEADLKKAYYVGNVRARAMRNAAEAAVLEYLSG